MYPRDTGSLLAGKWRFTPLLTEVVQYHHRLSQFAIHRPMIALVSLCDRICRANGLGYGYAENLAEENGYLLEILRDEWPAAKMLRWEHVSFEVKSYLNDVRKLVTVMFRLS